MAWKTSKKPTVATKQPTAKDYVIKHLERAHRDKLLIGALGNCIGPSHKLYPEACSILRNAVNEAIKKLKGEKQ